MRLRHILSTAVATVVGGGLQLLLTILVARLLTPEQNGHYAQFALIFNLVFIFLNVGLGTASTFFIASGRALVSDVLRVNVVVLMVIAILLTVFAAVIYWLGLSHAIEAQLKIPEMLFFIGIAAGLFFLAFNQALAILMGAHQYDIVNILNVARSGIPLIIIAAWALFTTSNVEAIAFTHAFGLVLVFGLSIWIAGSTLKGMGSRVQASSGFVFRDMLSYGAVVYFSNLLHYLAMRGILLILSYYSSPESVGFLSMALLLLEVMLLLPSAVGQLVFPQSSSLNFDSGPIHVALRVNLYISIFLVILTVALAEPIVSLLLGISYAPVAHTLVQLAPSVVLLTIPRILSQLLSGQGHPRYPLFAAAVSLILGGVLAVWIIPRWGHIGAAWITNLVSAITALVTVVGYCRVQRVTVGSLLIPRWHDLTGLRRLMNMTMRR